MPINYSDKVEKISVAQGFTSDICRQYFEFEHYQTNGIHEFSSVPSFFHSTHCFGYGGTEDGSTVELTICDPCLLSFCQQNQVQIHRA